MTKSSRGVANVSSATAVSVVTYRTATAAGTILTSTPSYTSRVLGRLSHMTRVFVPVINTSILARDTNYRFSSNTDGYARTESGQRKVTTSPRWLTQTSYGHSISDSQYKTLTEAQLKNSFLNGIKPETGQASQEIGKVFSLKVILLVASCKTNIQLAIIICNYLKLF